jgi:hypothetical protein
MENRDQSLWSAIPLIVGVAVIAILGLTALFWVAGIVFHLVGWAVHVAVVVALGFFFFRFIARRFCRTRV